MTSNININNIDGTFPVAGVSNDSQGFRNNFTNIKDNLGYAKREIEDLQNKSIVKSALSGTVIDNNMNGATFNGAEIYDLRETEHNIGIVSGAVILDHAVAHYHSLRTNGSITLSFTNLPDLGKVGRFRLKVTVTNTYHKITIPDSVTQGIDGLVDYDEFNKAITFSELGTYILEFITVDNGLNFHVQDLTRGSKIASKPYELPPASGSILGGVKIGATLTMSGSNVLNYNLPTATNLSLGGVKVSNLNGIALDESNALKLVTATDTQLGGIKVGTGLSINSTSGALSVKIPTFFNFATGNASPVPDSPILLGSDNTPDASLGKISGFNAYDSPDFPNKYYTGFTVVGAGVGAQIGMGWDIGAPGELGGSAGVAGTGAPTKMYFRVNDDDAPDGNGWSPWSRIMTEHDNLGGGISGGFANLVGPNGLSFPENPGGGGGDAAWIKYFAYSGEKTNLEIGVSNDGFGTAQDSINLVSPGGVGIGRQQPRRMLDVNGSGIFVQPASDSTTGAAILTASSNDTVGPILQFVDNADSVELGYIQVDATKKMTLKYGTGGLSLNDHLVISGSGLVGIGTQTSSRLAVAGLIESTTGGFKFPDGTVQTSANSGGGVGTYSLPYASTDRLGGIKVGGGLSIDQDGFLTVTGGGGGSGSTITVIGSAESQVFTTVGTTTWTAPSGVTKVKAYVIGGGAGGGRAYYDSEGGTTDTYGGAGGAAIGVYTVVPGTSYNIVVGAGSAGSISAVSTTGGASSFGSFCSASGGSGSGSSGGFGWFSGVGNAIIGTAGTGTGGTLRNSAMSSGLSGIFVGTSLSPSADVNPISWNVSLGCIPGSPGSTGHGGVGGAVYLEWTGTGGGSGGSSFNGNYDTLSNKPILFSGSYNDLTNKPTIPSAYTLPIATGSVLGGVKAGSGVSIAVDGTISSTSNSPWVGDTNGSWVGMYLAVMTNYSQTLGQENSVIGGTSIPNSIYGKTWSGSWKILNINNAGSTDGYSNYLHTLVRIA